jgi:hypothetical protein
LSAARAALASALLVGCAELIGVRDIPGAPDAGDAGADGAPDGADAAPPAALCSNASVVLTTSESLASVATSGGFVFGGGPTGIVGCGAQGACVDPPSLVQVGPTDTIESFSASSSLYFTVQDQSTPDAGSVHAAQLDGTGDQAILTALHQPMGIATAAGDAFWLDGDATSTSATVHCVGCAGQDVPWITQLTHPHAVLADLSNVYALSDDGTGALGIYGCAITSACGSTPQEITNGLDVATTRAELASDGAYVYVAQQTEIDRFDWFGTPTTVVTAEAVAIAVDGTTGDFYFAGPNGEIDVTAYDGTTIALVLSTCPLSVHVAGLAFDDTYLYALVQISGGWAVYAIVR